jgi:membrane-associated phospholipid phosphatase
MLAAAQDAITWLDAGLAQWFHAHSTPLGIAVCRQISQLGAPLPTAALGLLAASVSLLRRRRLEALVWVLALGGGLGISEVLKNLVRRPRPALAQDFSPLSYSFPSGHAMASIIAYGLLAYVVAHGARSGKRLAIYTAAALVVLAIGLARIYPQIHYLSDVLGGWLIGALWLATCIGLTRDARKRERHVAPPSSVTG